MTAVKKKVTFYELIMPINANITPQEYLKCAFNTISVIKKNSPTNLNHPLTSGNNLLIDLDLVDFNNLKRDFGLKLQYVKFNDYPSTLRVSDLRQRSLADDADLDEGIIDETHFVIDTSYKYPIIAVETNRPGPNASSLKLYLEWMCKRTNGCNFQFDILIEPVFGQKAEEFIKNMTECASLDVKIKRDNIGILESADEGLFTAIRAAQMTSGSDYVYLTIGYNFRVKDKNRPNTEKLKKLVNRLVQLNRDNPGYFEHFETLEIRGQEGEAPLQLFDLIADHTAEEIIVSRNDRSKNIRSDEFYNQAAAKIKEVFAQN